MAKLFVKSLKKVVLLYKIGSITVENAAVNSTFFEKLAVLLPEEGVHDFD